MLIRHLMVWCFILALSVSTLAAPKAQIDAKKPGGPIGGIIVKGGKNPGGQMLVLGSTDANGKFTISFIEAGEYQLSFDQTVLKSQSVQTAKAKVSFGEKVNAGLTLDYSVSNTNGTSRQASVHKKINQTAILITVPAGGASISGVVKLDDTLMASDAAGRAINESGVSVKSEPKKAVKK
jgi:hypothetical protein